MLGMPQIVTLYKFDKPKKDDRTTTGKYKLLREPAELCCFRAALCAYRNAYVVAKYIEIMLHTCML